MTPCHRFSRALMTTAIALSMTTTANAASVIRPGEQIEVTVYNHPDLSSADISVDGSGVVSLSLVGDVEIASLNETTAAQRIQAAYGRFLRHPAVAVRITRQAQSIFFTGAMNGVEPYQPGETLGVAIGSLNAVHTGDTNSNGAVHASSADLRNIRIERDGAILPSPIDLDSLAREGSSGPPLEPGDTIHLMAKPVRVQVLGDTKTPGTVYLYQGETLAQAVAEAGGFGPTDSLGNITLTRNAADVHVSSAGSVFTAPAQDGDIITLEPAPHVTVLGLVQKPGDVELMTSPTLMNALYQAGGPSNHADLTQIKVTRDGQTSVYDISKLMHGDASQNVPVRDGDIVLVPQGRRIDTSPIISTLGALASVRFLVTP